MAKGTNQKLKLLYLRQILLEQTDDEHAVSISQILSSLKECGISAERKSIYDDLECLRQFGMEIIGERRGREYWYHVGKREFELAELKLLVDSVESARFITAGKSRDLIGKLESLTSRYRAAALRRQVLVAGRVKSMNESIYYNVDALHTAIADGHQIRFQYFQWNVKKEMALRHDGAVYQVSPWALCRAEENYYLVAYDAAAGIIKHYRVDKMLRIEETDLPREGKDVFDALDMAVYTERSFSMFAGTEETVKLLCENRMAGAVIDRFGKDVTLIPADEDHFTVNVRVAVSGQFIHWVMTLEDGAKIIAPDRVVQAAKDEIARLARQYGME